MKMSIKRIICAVFAFAILVCAMSACGNKSGDTGDASSTGIKTQEVQGDDSSIAVPTVDRLDNPYATIPEDIKGQTVRFATWIDHWNTEGRVPLTNFYNDTGLNVELYFVPSDAYVDKLITAIASGDIPDAFKTNERKENFPLTIQLAAPIDVVSTVDLTEGIWHKSMLETATIDGHVYLVNTVGSPWSGSNLVFFNKSLFEDNGFKSPEEYYEEGNWTWATMKKAMKDIMSLGEGFSGGFVDPEVLADSAGASFCMYDYKTSTFKSGVNQKELLMAYQFYAELKEEGCISNSGFGDFIDGKSALVTTGVYGLKTTGHWKDMDWNDIGFTYLPSIDDSTPARISSIYRMYGIIAGAPHANAAGYFLRYWLDPDNYNIQEETFISKKAGNFYFELTNAEADEKYFNYDDACCALVGSDTPDIFYGKAANATPSAVNTELQAVSNVVDDAVKKANEIITTLRNKYK